MPVTYNSRNPAVKRLLKEAQELHEPNELYYAQPLEWHFTIRGPEDTDFNGGIYHGRILLPSEYPMKPPNIVLLTPNGRFETNRKICLSISGYHPESWRPSWSIRTALLAIIGFMPTHGVGAIGSLDLPSEDRKILAKQSQLFVCSVCGPIANVLLSLTELSRSLDREVNEAASQILMIGENETKYESPKMEQNANSHTNDNAEYVLSVPLSAKSSDASNSLVALKSDKLSNENIRTTCHDSVPSENVPISNIPGSGNPFFNCITSSNNDQVAYWVCYPTYYQTLPSNTLNFELGSTPNSNPVSQNERVPLSFSDWFKQMKEKGKIDFDNPQTDSNLRNTKYLSSSCLPVNNQISTENESKNAETIGSPNYLITQQDTFKSTKSLDQIKENIPTSSKLNSSNLPPESVHDSCSQENIVAQLPLSMALDPINDIQTKLLERNIFESSKDAEHVNATALASSNLSGFVKPEFPNESSNSTENVHETCSQEKMLDQNLLSNNPETNQIFDSTSVQETKLIESHMTSTRLPQTGNDSSEGFGLKKRQFFDATVRQNQIKNIVPTFSSTLVTQTTGTQRAVNMCAVGVAIALFVIVLRRMALMIQGI